MVMRMISEAGLQKEGYGIILPMSSIEPDSAVYYASLQFTKQGMDRVYGLHFVKGESVSKSKLDSIREAKLIYISGGDQNRFMEVVLGTEIEKAIHDAYRRGALVGGTSAGAAVMSKIMITGNELKHPDYRSTFRNIEADNIETKPGLGLITNAIIDQHFVARSRHNRLISAVIEYPEMTGIGIDESTAILVSGNQAEVVGESQVIVIRNKKRSKRIREGKLGAADLELSVLLPGDKFRIR
jgi:cyanophycinase